jgi:hypothetical protein
MHKAESDAVVPPEKVCVPEGHWYAWANWKIMNRKAKAAIPMTRGLFCIK